MSAAIPGDQIAPGDKSALAISVRLGNKGAAGGTPSRQEAMTATPTTSSLPAVRLEVHQGGRSVPYFFDQVDFLIGTVAGCDLRVPGANLPAVLCLLARHPEGLTLRRLAATQVLLLNGAAVSRAELKDGDRLTL